MTSNVYFKTFLLGTLQKHKWENAMTVDRLSWGFRRDMSMKDVLDMNELLFQLVSTVR